MAASTSQDFAHLLMLPKLLPTIKNLRALARWMLCSNSAPSHRGRSSLTAFTTRLKAVYLIRAWKPRTLNPKMRIKGLGCRA